MCPFLLFQFEQQKRLIARVQIAGRSCSLVTSSVSWWQQELQAVLGALGGALGLRTSLPPPCLACSQTKKALCQSFSICLFWQFGVFLQIQAHQFKTCSSGVAELTFAIRMTTVLLQELRSSFLWQLLLQVQVILLLYSALMRPHMECCVQV